MAYGLELRVEGLWFMAQGLELRVQGLRVCGTTIIVEVLGFKGLWHEG
jgi:hypothetical protein